MPHKTLQAVCLALGTTILLWSTASVAGSPEKQIVPKTGSVKTLDHYAPFLINNVFNYYGNNGDGSFNKFSSDNEGFEFYKGDGKHIIFEDGVVWGGFHKGAPDPKVGGSVYSHGLQAGPIITQGTATTDPVPAGPDNPAYRIYRVRPDIRPSMAFSAVESRLSTEEVPFIIRYETGTSAQSLYDSYVKDWNEWPAALGAPFTDVDGNGIYDPAIDVPGVAGADQTLWYVANDMDAARVSALAGSPPIGLEMQRTIWGYKRSGSLGNTIFASTILINKSGAKVDSMFLIQWSDPDLGDAGDDLVGCDTTRNLGYVYNGNPVDIIYGTAVPAGGFVLLQGPLVGSPGDSAVFKLKYRKGFKNLPMSAFVMNTQGNATYADPAPGTGGNIEWYRLMNGTIAKTGTAFHDPIAGRDTRFVFSGDPVMATDGSAGWVDGLGDGGVQPADRRMSLVTGPFTMAVGDTQEFVVASMAGLGADRLSSISALKAVRDKAQQAYNSMFKILPPEVSISVSYPSSSTAAVTVNVDGRQCGARSISGSFRSAEGVAGASFDLYDDGTHGDAVSGDKQFATARTIPTAQRPVSFDISLIDADGNPLAWTGVQMNICVAGPLSIAGVLFSDNINSDGKVNPGENVRFGISATNLTLFPLVRPEVQYVGFPGSWHLLSTIAPSATGAMVYNEIDPGSYYTFDVAPSYTDTVVRVPVAIRDSLGNLWTASISFPVVPLQVQPRSGFVNAVTGTGKGAFQISIVSPSAIKNHQYAIEGVTSINEGGTPGFSLRDITVNTLLLENHPLPDSLGHNSPVTDGFKVLRGSIDVRFGFSSYQTGSNGQRDVTWAGADPSATFANYLEGYSNSIGTGYSYPFIATNVTPNNLKSVTLNFAAADGTWNPKVTPSDPNFSRGYRFLRGAGNPAGQPGFAPWIINTAVNYGFQDYSYSVPFAAYDIDAVPPRRLAVGHLENNVPGGLVDGRYWPQANTDAGADNTSSSGPREWFFIFDLNYSDTPDATLGSATSTMSSGSNVVPLMWWGVVCRRGNFRSGTQFTINAMHPPATGQTWTFNPQIIASVQKADVPHEFALEQNYPNPFNPTTAIRYQLSLTSRVTLVVYDVLGREVAHLVDGVMNGGMHEVEWNARNVASGVYFYRLKATSQNGQGGSQVVTRKMLYLR